VRLIFEECGRFLKMFPDDLRSIRIEDGLVTLPHPFEHGTMMICGVEAFQRLEKLARYAGRQAGSCSTMQLRHQREERP
jgi:hypothetical protein